MKITHAILLTISFLGSSFQEGNCQNSEIEIPFGLEREIFFKDSYFPYSQMKRPKIVLALSGGGARGLAHIGVLKVLERQRLPVDGIAGTSMGAIVGGLYAVGYTAAQIESLAYRIRWNEIMRDAPPRKQLFLSQKEERDRYIFQLRLKGLSLDIPSAYTSGQNFTSLITDLILNAAYPPTSDFDELHIPFRAVATDLLTGNKTVIREGSLIEAMRASMAIPLLFTPVRIGEGLLVDGGLVQNIPVTEAQQLGADVVIAVDTSSKLRDAGSLKSPWEIADQATTIMQQENTVSEFEKADIHIQPDLHEVSNTDFDRIDDMIQAGEAAALAAIPDLTSRIEQKTSPNAEVYYQCDSVHIRGCEKNDPGRLRLDLSLTVPSLLSESQIVWAGRSLWQTGFFQDMHIVIDTLSHQLVFELSEYPWASDIQIMGNSVFPDSVLLSCLNFKSGEILNIHEGEKYLHTMMDLYHDRGYVLAHIDSIWFQGATLKIRIDEGRIDRIRISGNERTLPFVVYREFPLKPDSLFNVAQVKQGIENIYSTGYFEGVRFSIDNRMPFRDLTIHLIEQGYTKLRLGLRYDLERRTKGYLQIVEDNIFGLGGQGAVTGLLGHRDQFIEGRIWTDRFLKTFITVKMEVSSDSRSFDYYSDHSHLGTYNKAITQGSLTLGQQMRRLGTLSLRIRSEKVRLNPISGANIPRENFTLNNLTLRSEVDTRDRLPFPRSGKYHILEYEMAAKFLGSDVSYTKLTSSMESYYSPLHRLTLRPKITWGTSDLTTPFVKQFRLGGLTSFLGLPEEGFIGKRFIALSGEVRYQIPWPKWLQSYVTVRYDFGGIWGRYAKITSNDFKHGAGLIFSVDTPAGPVQVGYGHMSDGARQFYFSAGYDF
ncbi:patatin-like phospholipase family protein [bacterium]